MSKDLKPITKSSGMTPTTEDKKNITLISQLLKEIKKDKEEYNKIMKQVQDQQMEPKDILKILTLSAQKINGEYVSLEKSMYSLNEINYRDDNNGAENVRYCEIKFF